MKARNTKTGEIVTHFGYSKEWGTVSFVDQSGILRHANYESGTWEIIDDGDGVDWDAFRREAAKDILCAILRSNQTDDNDKPFRTFEDLAKCSVACADELIKQLQEKFNPSATEPELASPLRDETGRLYEHIDTPITRYSEEHFDYDSEWDSLTPKGGRPFGPADLEAAILFGYNLNPKHK